MNIYKITLLFAATLLLQAGKAQKTLYDANAQVRNVGSFTGISVSGAIDLYISMGDNAVAVSSKETSYTEKITTEVRNGVLYIEFNGKGISNWGPRSLKAYVSIKSINKLLASGACEVHVDGSLNAPDLVIDISGASDFNGAVTSQNLRLEGSGSSDFHISGTTVNAKIHLTGASDLKGFDLAADNCDIDASGSSDVKITVNKELKVKASGSSDISYKGNPAVKNVQSSGGADVKKAG